MKTSQFLWKLIMFRPGLYTLDALLVISSWLIFIIPGYVAREFFDALQVGEDNWWIWAVIALLVVGQFSRVILILFNIIIDVTFRNMTTALLRKNMIKKVVGHPASSKLPKSSSESISRFREDVDETADFLSWTSLLDVVGAAVFALVALVIMVRIDVLITLVVFLPMVAVVAVAHIVRNRVEKNRIEARETTGNLTELIGELFGSVQAIKVMSAEENVSKKFREVNQLRGKAAIKERLFTNILNATFTNIAEIGTGIILLLAASAMRDGSFTVGDFALFTYYLTWVTQLTGRFGMLTARYKQTQVSHKRMREILPTEMEAELAEHSDIYMKGDYPEIKEVRKKQEDFLNLFEIKGLRASYNGTDKGIEDIDLSIEKGTLTVVTGEIGSGKSTLLSAILGLVPIQSGEIFWNQSKVEDVEAFFEPPRASYVSQVPQLFSDSFYDNIATGEKSKENIYEAIRLAQLEQDLEQLEDGLDTVIGTRGRTLSGGQMQRTALARALAKDPELLVLDDISSALDSRTEEKLFNELLEKNKFTCVVSSYRPFVLQKADQIVVMKDGRIEAVGKIDQLLEISPTMRKLWEKEVEQVG
ncbi:ABC transporter ATP-binding protein [Ornithinibacillus scapharcae]|uniref:ABC transporter ATP-binding protein n=1 Tax=Ornithinibacillus scapharcae TaxID=1147159 RepID=UPI000225AB9B|nr:ABC transporter ATP-binding protein [Ornithinibacillus scapharcae]